jgi:hypothetical protein
MRMYLPRELGIRALIGDEDMRAAICQPSLLSLHERVGKDSRDWKHCTSTTSIVPLDVPLTGINAGSILPSSGSGRTRCALIVREAGEPW